MYKTCPNGTNTPATLTPVSWTTIKSSPSPSNLTVNSYGPYTDFRYVRTVTLSVEIWSRVKVMTHPWVMDNNCEKYYPDPTCQWGAMARTRILGICVHCDLAFGIWPLVKVMTHPWAMENNNYCVKYYSDPTWQWQVMARTGILWMCALWTWPWRYDLGSSSWHTLGSWTAIVWNIIFIQHSSEELCPDTYFVVYVDLAGMNSGQSHDTPLLLGQQWCDILSRSNMAVTSYGPDTEIGYVCTVNLTLEIWFLVKVMTHHLGLWHMTMGQGHDTSLGNGH